MRSHHDEIVFACLLAGSGLERQPVTMGQTPAGEIKGAAVVHTTASRPLVVSRAAVALPAAATGAAPWQGNFSDVPALTGQRVPVVVFLHGSSGLSLKAIGEWQAWLASLGVASFAPDSFGLADRLTYTSPIAKDTYERIHALRASEIGLAMEALRQTAWADPSRIVLAGASEGGPAVARYEGSDIAARMIYSWSCEDNYFVDAHRTAVRPELPVLNVMSMTDVFFSPSNPWLGNAAAKGHCGDVVKGNRNARVVLIAGAPHTLLNLAAARQATEGFLRELVLR
jgi:dienelactone hydrolase